ncbi:hypothetical protein OTU49_010184 [Cherax quadricarinatus]|uniref:Uncharacterized protein n=1 Tax=Cherax quadricarinatus TaxID=27406 RepID=A0AAW0WET2_CHEQU
MTWVRDLMRDEADQGDDLTEAASGDLTEAASGDLTEAASGDLTEAASGDLTEAASGDQTGDTSGDHTEDTNLRVILVKISTEITKPEGLTRILHELGRLLTHSRELPSPSDEIEYSRMVHVEGPMEKSRYSVRIKIACSDKASGEKVTCWVTVDTDQRCPEKEEVDLLALWLLDCVTCQNYSEKDIIGHLKREVISFYMWAVRTILGYPTLTVFFDQDPSEGTRAVVVDSGQPYRKSDAAQ